MNKTKTRSKITIDELARMVNNGFKEQAKNLEDFKVEVRTGFREIRKEFTDFKVEVRGEFKEIKHSLKGHRHELDDHETRIHKVEKDMDIA